MVRNMPDEFGLEKPEPWEREDSWDSWEEKQEYFERLAEHKQLVAEYWELRKELHNQGNAGGGFNYCSVCGGGGEVPSRGYHHASTCPACFGTGLFEVTQWE
jgi:hypothetical protein